MTDSSLNARRRRNMSAQDRERQILNESVRYFAETGFEGQTRELAKRIGITHAAIYRHFESKEALIERVYEHVYTSRWRPEWEDLIRDRALPLEERMVQFYLSYAECVFAYDWVRIFVSAGIKGYGLPARYLEIIRDRVIIPAIQEWRGSSAPPTDADKELFWGLHGSIFYIGIRNYVYEMPVSPDVPAAVEATVRNFFRGLAGAPDT